MRRAPYPCSKKVKTLIYTPAQNSFTCRGLPPASLTDSLPFKDSLLPLSIPDVPVLLFIPCQSLTPPLPLPELYLYLYSPEVYMYVLKYIDTVLYFQSNSDWLNLVLCRQVWPLSNSDLLVICNRICTKNPSVLIHIFSQMLTESTWVQISWKCTKTCFNCILSKSDVRVYNSPK